ncbi:MAG: hypothetical protein ACTSU2_16430 [Promethearchaeota archaeon]
MEIVVDFQKYMPKLNNYYQLLIVMKKNDQKREEIIQNQTLAKKPNCDLEPKLNLKKVPQGSLYI